MPETGWGPTGPAIQTPKQVGYGLWSPAVSWTQKSVNIRVLSVSVNGTSGDVTISYTLANSEAKNGSVRVEYRLPNSTSFSRATKKSGSNVNTLPTDNDGIAYTFVWDTATDLGVEYSGNAIIQISAFDQTNQNSSKSTSDEVTVAINNAPLAATILWPVEGYFLKQQLMPFRVRIPDPNAGYSDCHCEINVDTSSDFTSNFGRPLHVFESRLDQDGWFYSTVAEPSSNSEWVAMPFAGIPIISNNALVGNQVRYVVQDSGILEVNTVYWVRARFGGVLT